MSSIHLSLMSGFIQKMVKVCNSLKKKSFNTFKQHLVQLKQLYFNLHRRQFHQNIALLSLIKISN
jgi:hypothetical protein